MKATCRNILYGIIIQVLNKETQSLIVRIYIPVYIYISLKYFEYWHQIVQLVKHLTRD